MENLRVKRSGVEKGHLFFCKKREYVVFERDKRGFQIYIYAGFHFGHKGALKAAGKLLNFKNSS